MHYVALFASYINEEIHKETLLALDLLLNDESLGAEQHIELMISALLVYNNHLDNVVTFIGDNCLTNRKISNDCGIPLMIGCTSHRFNLAVNKMWLENEVIFQQVFDDIQNMMVELQKLKKRSPLFVFNRFMCS